MDRDVRTCPHCGALITPQLARCRQCGTYLHGTWLEGMLVERLLPAGLRASPGTGLLVLLISLAFIFQTLVAGPQQVFSFSSYSLHLLGANFAPRILMGEGWRFVTAMFSHGGLLHVAFNLYALTIVGPVVEEVFDRKKMWFLALVAGVGSMVVSFGWGVFVMGRLFHASVGASGAVAGLIGAAWMGGRRLGPGAAPMVTLMKRWTIYMAIFGLVISGIDNAAHAGGWVLGAVLGHVIPVGLTRSVAVNRALSVGMLAALAGIGVCFALMVSHMSGFPGRLEDDAEPRRFLLFGGSPGTAFEHSSQKRASDACRTALQDEDEDAVQACRFAVRAWPGNPFHWVALEAAYRESGRSADADRVRRVVSRLSSRSG
jgi:rhomboid protease GluP